MVPRPEPIATTLISTFCWSCRTPCPENLAGQALGQVWQTAQRGHVADHQKIAALTWSEPDVVNAPLVNVVKRFGVRVPW